jgi:hypothetical protein
VWESVPAGAWVPVENAAAPTSPATIGSKNVGVLTYAHAVQASLNLVNRSAFGGYANSDYEQTGIDYLAKKESKAVATAQGAATAVSLAGVATTVGAIGKLVAACIAQQTDTANPDGPEFRGLLPEYAAVAADLWSDLVETKALNGPAFSSGSIQWGQLSGSLSGLVVMMVPALTAGKLMVGARAATVVHDENELQLRSTVVNTLSVELGVIGNAAFDVEYPDALAKGAAPFTPTGTTAPAAAKSK